MDYNTGICQPLFVIFWGHLFFVEKEYAFCEMEKNHKRKRVKFSDCLDFVNSLIIVNSLVYIIFKFPIYFVLTFSIWMITTWNWYISRNNLSYYFRNHLWNIAIILSIICIVSIPPNFRFQNINYVLNNLNKISLQKL